MIEACCLAAESRTTPSVCGRRTRGNSPDTLTGHAENLLDMAQWLKVIGAFLWHLVLCFR